LYALRGRKVIFIILSLASFAAWAQPNLEQYDNKLLHFGFTVSLNIGRMYVETNPTQMVLADTVLGVRTKSFPGIGLGAITNLRLGKFWDLRLVAPVISFVQRNIIYDFPNGSKEVKIESAYCDGSVLLKYKSDRRKNTRVYVAVGPRLSYDFGSSVSRTRGLQNPVVSLNPVTVGWEAAFGLDMYFEYFKFSPEIKTCQTWSNALYHDGFIYTNVIDKITPQLIMISFHFE
jgi:hypothetical protein